MKRLLTFIIAAIIFFPCGAQSWEEIKSSRQYIYGEGWGSSDAEADPRFNNEVQNFRTE